MDSVLIELAKVTCVDQFKVFINFSFQMRFSAVYLGFFIPYATFGFNLPENLLSVVGSQLKGRQSPEHLMEYLTHSMTIRGEAMKNQADIDLGILSYLFGNLKIW